MDGERFDMLLKTVTAGSRRRLLRRVLGGALGVGALGALSTRPTAAAQTWCDCTYFCEGHFVGSCEKAIDGECPEDSRIQGVNCNNIPMDDLVCGPSKQDVCG